MSHASPPTSNSSLSSSSSVGVVMRYTPIIFAFEIMGDGAGREIFGDELSHSLADARLAWAHLDANHADTAADTIILHVAPEAAIGGPLALVQTGDRICLDVAGRRLELLVSDEELARRRSALQLPIVPPKRGYGKLFHDHVVRAPGGVDFDFL